MVSGRRTPSHLPAPETFTAVFGVGGDRTKIHPVDAAGVALAAIQDLHRNLLREDAAIRRLERRVAVLRRQIEDRGVKSRLPGRRRQSRDF